MMGERKMQGKAAGTGAGVTPLDGRVSQKFFQASLKVIFIGKRYLKYLFVPYLALSGWQFLQAIQLQ